MGRRRFPPGKISDQIEGSRHPDALPGAASGALPGQRQVAGPCALAIHTSSGVAAGLLPPPPGSKAPKWGAQPGQGLGKQQQGAWRGCWRQRSPGRVGGPGPRRAGASRCVRGQRPAGRPGKPPTIRKRVFQPPAPRTPLSERNEPGGVGGGLGAAVSVEEGVLEMSDVEG